MQYWWYLRSSMAAIDFVFTRQKLTTFTKLLSTFATLRVQGNQLKCLNLFCIQQCCASCWVVECSGSHYGNSFYKVQESNWTSTTVFETVSLSYFQYYNQE